jgi:hypothetical protein
VAGHAITPALDLLNYDRRVRGGAAAGKFELDPPFAHISFHALGCWVTIHAGNRKSIPAQVSHDRQDVAAGPACP